MSHKDKINPPGYKTYLKHIKRVLTEYLISKGITFTDPNPTPKQILSGFHQLTEIRLIGAGPEGNMIILYQMLLGRSHISSSFPGHVPIVYHLRREDLFADNGEIKIKNPPPATRLIMTRRGTLYRYYEGTGPYAKGFGLPAIFVPQSPETATAVNIRKKPVVKTAETTP